MSPYYRRLKRMRVRLDIPIVVAETGKQRAIYEHGQDSRHEYLHLLQDFSEKKGVFLYLQFCIFTLYIIFTLQVLRVKKGEKP
jgi:hypothetical protein